MATYNWQVNLPFSASGDLSSHQYKFVKPATTAKRVLLANGASNPAPLGVLQNDPISGEEAQVCFLGVSQLWVSSSANIAYGDFLRCGSAGGAELHNEVGASAANGIALEAMSAGSGYIEALIFPFFSILWDNVP